jgi:hypothetical protein
MWSGKAAAKTFFARFFDNKKQAKTKEADAVPRRKRSHSLFAPNLNALITGEHVGGVMGPQSLLAGMPMEMPCCCFRLLMSCFVIG